MRAALLAALALVACAPALHEPPPISALAPGRAGGRSADQLMHDADAAWQRRATPGQAAAAADLYLDAAAADPRRVDALLGAIRALSFRVEREPEASRGRLAEQAVEVGQWCQRRAPNNPECDYRLALALGQQARARTSTGHDALSKIVELLHRAIAQAPDLDAAGPHRVLALVLLRAPSWPLGPGDPEAALAEARTAAQRFPRSPENQLVLGEALAANHAPGEAHAAYGTALALASSARAAGDADAGQWVAEARAGLAKTAGR